MVESVEKMASCSPSSVCSFPAARRYCRKPVPGEAACVLSGAQDQAAPNYHSRAADLTWIGAFLRLAECAGHGQAGDLRQVAADGVPDALAVEVVPEREAALPKNLQDLIREMHRENPTWGEERIANELDLKLGMRVSPRTVRKYPGGRSPRGKASGGRNLDLGWLRNSRSQSRVRPRAIVMHNIFFQHSTASISFPSGIALNRRLVSADCIMSIAWRTKQLNAP
jgi:hypothetical protein